MREQEKPKEKEDVSFGRPASVCVCALSAIQDARGGWFMFFLPQEGILGWIGQNGAPQGLGWFVLISSSKLTAMDILLAPEGGNNETLDLSSRP